MQKKRKEALRRKRIISIVISILALIVAGGFVIDSFMHVGDADLSEKEETVEAEVQVDEISIEEPTSIIFTGDVLLSDYVLSNYDSGGLDAVLDTSLQKELNDADILMVNHEFPFSTRGEQAKDKQYTFRVDPGYVEILQGMGVDIAGLANNHVLDFGRDALSDTFDTLTSAGISYTGAGDDLVDASKLITYDISGKKYGFLAASRVIPVASWNIENGGPGVFCTYDTTYLIEDIKKAKESCDYVFVMVHWGMEHTIELEDYQPSIGHALIDAGADAVIGAHPHVLQEIEYYEGKPIFYSLGNFIFNTTIDSTVAVKMEFTDGEDNPVITLIPAYASNAMTHEADSARAEEIFSYLESISEGITISDNGQVE